MQYITAFTLGAAGLAMAAPSSQAPNTLERRIAPSSNCGLDMYPSVDQGSVGGSITYLKGKDSSYALPTGGVWVDAGSCTVISCSYGTGVTYCLADVGQKIPHTQIDPGQAATDIQSTYRDCYGGDPDQYGGVNRAFQHWGTGYNILVDGGHSC